MNRFLLVLSILLSTLFLSRGKEEVYFNKEYNFEVKIPQGWHLTPDVEDPSTEKAVEAMRNYGINVPDIKILAVVHKNRKFEIGNNDGVVIIRASKSIAPSIDELFQIQKRSKDILEERKKLAPDKVKVSYGSIEKIILNGTEGIKLEFFEEGYKEVSYIFIKNGEEITLKLIAKKENFDKFRTSFNIITESFKFCEPAESSVVIIRK